MRIGIVLPAAPAYSETFFFNKIEGLERHGISVTIFANKPRKTSIDRSTIKVATQLSGNKFTVTLLTVYLLIYSVLFNFRKTKRLYMLDKKDGLGFLKRLKNIVSSSHILTENIDWLHFGFGTMVFDKENVAKAIDAKMAVSFRGFDIGVYPLKHPNCYSRLWNKVDRIHVISKDIEDLVYKNGFNGKAEIVKITPAIDISLFKNDEVSYFSTENKLITIARLHWKKGLIYTLEALSCLKDEGIPFHYTIIGDGEEKERLKFAIYQLGLENNVTLKGKVEHEQVITELKKAELYVQYSIQEGFCNAVLEAQAAGLLCVVSNAEGLSENVLDNETGWVVPKCDAKALARKIKQIIYMPREEKEQVIINAKKRVSKQFILKQQQEQFVEFYKN